MGSSKVPVIALTGHLGAGKTTLLNALLRSPGARVGVVVNDFGSLAVDAALVTGQVDEPAAISGGCVCCMPDAGGLDDALEKLARPELRLDAILVEASGAAEPLALARLIRFSGAEGVRPGGVIEVIDAVEHFRTVDVDREPPLRLAAATLVVIGKVDLLEPGDRGGVVERIRSRVRARNPHATIVVPPPGGMDPAIVFDTATDEDPVDELPIAALLRDTVHEGEGHVHLRSAAAPVTDPVSPSALVDLLEDPPEGTYRLKGRVRVRGLRREQGLLVNVVGRTIHVAPLAEPPVSGELVVIGTDLDPEQARARLRAVLDAPADRGDPAGLRRLRRHRRLSD